MARKRVTSQQVADRAGVSRTTVSFVLNNVTGIQISEATRQRVLRAARELDYVPNAAARSLASGQTRTLGLVFNVPREHLPHDVFIHQLLHILSEASHVHGFRVLVEAVEDIDQPNAYLNLARAKQIDGILLLGPRSDDEQLPALIAEGFPVVLLGRLPSIRTYSVGIDDTVFARLAVSHLVELGHRRVASISYAPPAYVGAADRLSAYRSVLEDAGLPYDESLVRFGEFSAGSGYRAMASLLQGGPPPTALFAGNDTIALGAMAAIHEQGLRVPQDISVVGYDDIPGARYFNPPLTTVRSPAIEQGMQAVDMLIKLIEGEIPEEKERAVEAEMVLRASTARPRSNV